MEEITNGKINGFGLHKNEKIEAQKPLLNEKTLKKHQLGKIFATNVKKG